MTSPHKNRLSGSASPYLLMHADNPVDWYPWGEEAFEAARNRDCFVFLSIGYTACHWCHVMEKECFRDLEVASLINDFCIPVKVDREERPDIDHLYMAACQMMTGSGGWPLSIFLSPDKKPFFAGTYIPKKSGPAGVGMMDLIPHLAILWKEKRSEIGTAGNTIIEAAGSISNLIPGNLSDEAVHLVFQDLTKSCDPRFGGFSRSPKFPEVPRILFLLCYSYQYRNENALLMAEKSLQEMALRGIRDHLDGGFYRYATDREWKVPHFEKMLIDQALLVTAYLQAYQISGDPLYQETATGILDFVSAHLTSPCGGFYTSIDADTTDGEGAFYLWTETEIREILGEKDGTIFCSLFGVTKDGNCTGHGLPPGSNVLHPESDPKKELQKQNIPQEWLSSVKKMLYTARSKREKPAADEKICVDQNALMITAFIQGYQALGYDHYYKTAKKAAACLLLHHLLPDGRLLHHRYRDQPGSYGTSSDYIHLCLALLSLFSADGKRKWLDMVFQLIPELINLFSDPKTGGFFITGNDHSDLPLRQKDLSDSAYPSGNGMAAILFSRLSLLTGDEPYQESYQKLISLAAGEMNQGSGALLSFFLATMEHECGYRVLALSPDKEEGKKLLQEVYHLYLPGSIIIPVMENVAYYLPEITGYPPDPALYICGPKQCFSPIHSGKELSDWIFENQNR
ncbi:MAG: thioredoxin domain-containing protein [Methanospirillaceae archaeon]|nr:thioredoxin domain-containing protein [Methanospirillaceae archaeon]